MNAHPDDMQNGKDTEQSITPVLAPHALELDKDAPVKIFRINGLVRLILERVPSGSRSPLRKVSTAWNSIISELDYAFGPSPEGYFGNSPEIIDDGGPFYRLDSTIRINETLNSSKGDLNRPSTAFVALEDVHDRSELLSKRREFISTPPITTIMVALRSTGCHPHQVMYHQCHAILREHTGVRISHLLDTLDKMRLHVPLAFDEDSGTDYPVSQPVAYFCMSGPDPETFLEEGYESRLVMV